MRGTSHAGNDAEACPRCGEIYSATGLGVHMARAHGVEHRRSAKRVRCYSAERAENDRDRFHENS